MDDAVAMTAAAPYMLLGARAGLGEKTAYAKVACQAPHFIWEPEIPSKEYRVEMHVLWDAPYGWVSVTECEGKLPYGG